MRLNFHELFSKNSQISNFNTSVQWEPSYFMRTDGRTDGRRDGYGETNSRFSEFCERVKTIDLHKELIAYVRKTFFLTRLNVSN